jgi:hypothetical protein
LVPLLGADGGVFEIDALHARRAVANDVDVTIGDPRARRDDDNGPRYKTRGIVDLARIKKTDALSRWDKIEHALTPVEPVATLHYERS